jgi:hypothetical protein
MPRIDQQMIDDFRQMLNWLEDHPSCPLPTEILIQRCNIYAETLPEFLEIRRQLEAGGEKKSISDTIYFTRRFGDLELDININKDNSCERVKVGERVIPAQPERTEPVYEWKCPDSLLGKREPQESA